MGVSSTRAEFIEKARKIHGDKYIYTEVNYKNSRTKVCIICPEHGAYWSTPHNHLNGYGCPKCSKHKTWTFEDFVNCARKVHDNKYEYVESDFKNITTKCKIICPEHGEFWQIPRDHLHGKGCLKCAIKNKQETKEHYLSICNKIHNGKYSYEKTEYQGARNKIIVTCPIHGDFMITARHHKRGHGCPKCARERNIKARKWTTEKFINEAIKVHKDKYIYTNVNYDGWYTPVCIICPTHGEFWQTPECHLHGCGCKQCTASKLENRVFNVLSENQIKFELEYKTSWIKRMHLDFYLPEYNIAIECQGGQHFESIEWFGGEKGFNKSLQRDKTKKQLCEEHGVKLLYYSEIKEFTSFLGEPLYKDTDSLLNEINKIINEQQNDINAKFK